MIVISVMPTNIRGRFIFEIHHENLFFYVKLREILIGKKLVFYTNDNGVQGDAMGAYAPSRW